MKEGSLHIFFLTLGLAILCRPVTAGLLDIFPKNPLTDFLKGDSDDEDDDNTWNKIFESGEKACGYLGGSASKVEDKLDSCYDEYVKESRVRMSIGFELCFGFNFARLNNTVSKPLNYMQRIVNTKVLDLSLEICQAHDDIERRPKLDSGAVDIDSEQAQVGQCKVFFDRVIDAVYAEDYSVDDVFRTHGPKLEPMYSPSELEKVEKKVRDLVHPIDECKVPEQTLKDNLIVKYTKKFLQAVVNPKMPSFNYENLDVLLHPEKYMLKNENPDFPNFDDMLDKEKAEHLKEAEESGDREAIESIRDPTKRFVVMRGKPKHGGRVIMKPRAYGELSQAVKDEILQSDEMIRNINTVLEKNPLMMQKDIVILKKRREEELAKWWNRNADQLYREGKISKEEMEKTLFRPSTHMFVKGKLVMTKDAPKDQFIPHVEHEQLIHKDSRVLFACWIQKLFGALYNLCIYL